MKLDIIKSFAERHSFLGDPRRACNKCISASMWFLADMGVPPGRMHLYMRSGIIDGEEHHWVEIDGLCYDWTARQYDPSASFPRVWKSLVELPLQPAK